MTEGKQMTPLSKYEQETVILYNQAEQTADVYTHDPKLLEKLKRLTERRTLFCCAEALRFHSGAVQ